MDKSNKQFEGREISWRGRNWKRRRKYGSMKIWRRRSKRMADKNFCNRVWKREGWPEEWRREGIVVTIVKKGKGKKVEDYRGVTLMQTAYKVYAAVLAKRLRKKVEGKEILPPS